MTKVIKFFICTAFIVFLFTGELTAESFFKTVYLTGYSFGETEYGTPCIIRDNDTEQQEINLFNEIELDVTEDQLSKCHENLAYSDDRVQIHTYFMSQSRAYDRPTEYDPFFIFKAKAADGSVKKRIFLSKMKDHGGIKEIKKVYEAKNGTIYFSVLYIVTNYDGHENWESLFSINKNNELSYLIDFRTDFRDNDSYLYCSYGFLEDKNRVLFWLADNYCCWPSVKLTTSILDLTTEAVQLKYNEYWYTEHLSIYEGIVAYLPEESELYNKGQLVYKAEEDTMVKFTGTSSYEGIDENGIWNQKVYFYIPDGNNEIYVEGQVQLDKIKFVHEIIKTETLTKGDLYWTQDRLRLRDSESLNGNIITTLNTDTKLKLLRIGKEDKIDGISSNWVYVKVISTGEKGWCFAGYIDSISIYK